MKKSIYLSLQEVFKIWNILCYRIFKLKKLQISTHGQTECKNRIADNASFYLF